VVAYIEKEYELPAVSGVDWVSAEPVGDTCYERVTFMIRGVVPTITLRYFLSPDRRFLSHGLLDTTEQVPSDASDRSQAPTEDQPLLDVAHGDYPSKGAESSPVTLTIFTDFQCPYCKGGSGAR
jgi:hypothetical protein